MYEDRVRVKSDFDALWEVKLSEIVDRKMEAAKRWLESDPQAPFKVQKELHMLKRKFYASPTPETAELERALRDPSNAIFAHMANLLYKENKTLHTFFHQFDKEVCLEFSFSAGLLPRRRRSWSDSVSGRRTGEYTLSPLLSNQTT